MDSSRLARNPTIVAYPVGELWVRNGFVAVRDHAIPSVERGREALAAIDEALIESGYRCVLFDTRELPPPTDEINTLYWNWVMAGAHHDRVALLVRSEMKRVEGNMRALSKGVHLRSFHQEIEATRWLRRLLPKRH